MRSLIVMGNKHMVRRALVVVIAGLMLGVTAVLPVAAAASTVPISSGNGFKISPVVTNLVMQPGQSQTVVVYVQNVTNGQVILQSFINDFTSTDETGTPALLLNNQFAPSHSLKRYIESIGNITLAPGQQKGVNVIIDIPKDASGGGYYGAVRFAPAAAGNSSNVTLSASVGSLILVRVPGNVKEQVKLASLDIRRGEKADPGVLFTSGESLVAVARFQNTGDVQEQPFGKILLEQGSKVLATYEINNINPRGNILPSSVRRFTVDLTKVGVFGKYTLVGNFGYGTNGQLISGKTTFYVVPIPAIITAIVVIILIVAAVIVFPKLVRAYNRRILAKANRK